MSLFAATSSGAGPLAIAAALGALGVWLLLPKPRNRNLALGTFAALAAAIVLAVWVVNRFGPVASNLVEKILFWLFASAAVLFAGVFITQRNPARGAISFAFVILSVCGLFLLLAAPFLMAATIIVYAGAIIVTFLFVLMLSQTRLASDENDRSREPMLGSLAGFSFLGLVLFALYTSSPAGGDYALPSRPMLPSERTTLLATAEQLRTAPALTNRDDLLKRINDVQRDLASVVGGPNAPRDTIPERTALILDPETTVIRQKAEQLRESHTRLGGRIENTLLKATVTDADRSAMKNDLEKLETEVRLLAAHGELPARNVAAMGYVLYTDYILAVELVGAILLAATVGAVRIASRREAA